MKFIPPEYKDLPTVTELVTEMDKRVTGLEEPKRILALTMRRFMVAAANDRQYPPSNILVIGPTGGGKTFLLRRLLEACPVVTTEVNMTEYSDVGYFGRDLTSMYIGLTSGVNRGVKQEGEEPWRMHDMVRLAERWGVIVLDEFDKMKSNISFDARPRKPNSLSSGDRQVGKQLQAEMLKLAEGTEALVKRSDNDSNGYFFRTHNVLHIAVGAFQGLDRIVAGASESHIEEHGAYRRATLADIADYGFMEELVGRFATIVTLPPLDAGHLAIVLKDQILPHYVQQCADEGIELIVEEGACMTLGSQALKEHFGARVLDPLLYRCLRKSWSEAKAGDRLVLDADGAVRQHAELVCPAGVGA